MPKFKGNRGGLIIRAAALILLLVAAGLAAQEIPFSHGVLYRVQFQDSHPSYLFGTMHTDDPRVTRLPEAVDAAFRESASLAVEITMEPEDILVSIAAMILDDGLTLSEVVGEELYRRTMRAARAKGFPEEAVRNYKPWAMAVLLSMPPVRSGHFLDLVLYERARAEGKQVVGIETTREQIGLFDDLSLDEQVHYLEEAINAQDDLPALLEELMKAYLERDLGRLYRLSEPPQEGSLEMERRFYQDSIDKRNGRMADRLEPLLRKGRLFVAVGALHLPGERGVLNLLLQRGYQIERRY